MRLLEKGFIEVYIDNRSVFVIVYLKPRPGCWMNRLAMSEAGHNDQGTLIEEDSVQLTSELR